MTSGHTTPGGTRLGCPWENRGSSPEKERPPLGVTMGREGSSLGRVRSCWLTASLTPFEAAHARKAASLLSSSLPSTSILLDGECELDRGLCSDAHVGDSSFGLELTALRSAL